MEANKAGKGKCRIQESGSGFGKTGHKEQWTSWIDPARVLVEGVNLVFST